MTTRKKIRCFKIICRLINKNSQQAVELFLDSNMSQQGEGQAIAELHCHRYTLSTCAFLQTLLAHMRNGCTISRTLQHATCMLGNPALPLTNAHASQFITRCQAPAKLQCPKCLELKLPKTVSVFCSQDCFRVRSTHKPCINCSRPVVRKGYQDLLPQNSLPSKLHPKAAADMCESHSAKTTPQTRRRPGQTTSRCMHQPLMLGFTQ